MTLPESIRPKVRYLQLFVNDDLTIQWRFINKSQIEPEIKKSLLKDSRYTTKILAITNENVVYDPQIKKSKYVSFKITRSASFE